MSKNDAQESRCSRCGNLFSEDCLNNAGHVYKGVLVVTKGA